MKAQQQQPLKYTVRINYNDDDDEENPYNKRHVLGTRARSESSGSSIGSSSESGANSINGKKDGEGIRNASHVVVTNNVPEGDNTNTNNNEKNKIIIASNNGPGSNSVAGAKNLKLTSALVNNLPAANGTGGGGVQQNGAPKNAPQNQNGMVHINEIDAENIVSNEQPMSPAHRSIIGGESNASTGNKNLSQQLPGENDYDDDSPLPEFPCALKMLSLVLSLIGLILLIVALVKVSQTSGKSPSIAFFIIGALCAVPGFFYLYKYIKLVTAKTREQKLKILKGLPRY